MMKIRRARTVLCSDSTCSVVPRPACCRVYADAKEALLLLFGYSMSLVLCMFALSCLPLSSQASPVDNFPFYSVPSSLPSPYIMASLFPSHSLFSRGQYNRVGLLQTARSDRRSRRVGLPRLPHVATVLTGGWRKMLERNKNAAQQGLPESKFWRYNKLRSNSELSKGIANLYDDATPIWEVLWGEHLHHGLYPEGKYRPDHKQAQVDMIDRVLEWALPSGRDMVAGEQFVPRRVLDVGCGVGGSSRHIAKKFRGSTVTGITLSPHQCRRAEIYSKSQHLDDVTKFEVVNALNTPYSSGSYDLIWSMESGEHMPDKHKFVGELTRLVAPNGRVIVVTWCHRNLKNGEKLSTAEKRLLSAINYCYYLPDWWSIENYKKCFHLNGLVDIRTDDWTPLVQHFWPAVVKSAFSIQGIKGALTGGVKTFRGVVALAFMVLGYRTGLVQFQLITARKPKRSEAWINTLLAPVASKF
eukprot:GHVS01028722.1.p1 GENE.GHVS01028722.1~~GHVS01028722.1.p1  ORF type:complete len:470 (-),score=36.85 GHVS01028722.1:803-2212(-)